MLLLKILYVILAIVLGLAVLLILATIPHAGVRIYGKDGALSAWLRYGWLRIRIFPLPARLSAGKPKKETGKPKEKPVKESPYDFTGFDMGGAAYLLLELLEELRGALHLEVIRIQVLIGTGNAAATGILLGSCAAITGMLTPFLVQNFNIRDYHIAVDGDFESGQTHWEADVSFSVRPIRLLWALMRRWRKIRRLYISIQKTEAIHYE